MKDYKNLTNNEELKVILLVKKYIRVIHLITIKEIIMIFFAILICNLCLTFNN